MKHQNLKLSTIFVSALIGSASYASTINTLSVIDSSGLGTMNISNMNGAMETLPHAPLASGVGSSAIASTPYQIDQKHQYVFMVNPGTNTISVFRPQLDGSLLDLKLSAVTGKNPNFLAIDAKGLHLYATNKDDKTVSVYSINQETGALTRVDNGTITTEGGPSSIALSSSRAIVTNRDSNTITMYSVDPTNGNLAKLSSSAVGTHPILAKIIKEKYVHVLNEGDNGMSNISQLSLPETGASMVKLQPEKVGVPANAQFMATRADEKYTFVASKRDDHKDSIQVLEVTSAGTLTPIQTMIEDTILTGSDSSIKRSLSVDPRNKVIYASNAELGTVSSYTVEPATGKINSTPVAIQKVTNPVGFTDVHTQGVPVDVDITEDSGDYSKSAHVDVEDHDAHFAFTFKNPNQNAVTDAYAEICLVVDNRTDIWGNTGSDEECFENGKDITVYNHDGSMYFVSIKSNDCPDSFEGNAECHMQIDVDPGTTVGASEAMTFHMRMGGRYDDVLYQFIDQDAKVNTVDTNGPNVDWTGTPPL